MSISNLSDEQLAERLRKENCDQFNTLVRMHLSFVLDLNTDETDGSNEKGKLKKWLLTPFKRSKQRSVPEGVNLTRGGIDQVRYLIEFLKKESNICTEGIFRRTGSLNRQQDLRNLLNSGSELSLEGGQYNVHDCASVLKGFLSDLPEPLLTEAHYPVYCQIANLRRTNDKFKEGTRFLESLQLLHLLLPSENRILLKHVLDLLNLTASYENLNKMSVENLATLYTPHLLCPRKISAENLHTNSQILSEILAYMISRSSHLFHIPPKLAFDIRAFFAEQRSERDFDESIGDNLAAHTVFSFVDHVRTAKENETNPTERELAQLYAYIQGLPESSKKRKLVKQFNKENGYGTPLQIVRSRHQKNRSLGDSIKKHIFHRGPAKSARKAGFSQLRSSNENFAGETMMTPRSRKPVLVVSGTNIHNLPRATSNLMSSLAEERETDETRRSGPDSLTDTFREYLCRRSILTESPNDASFSSRTDDYSSSDIKDLSASRMSSSLLRCLDGDDPADEEKELVLKPKQFDENGLPVVFETSF